MQKISGNFGVFIHHKFQYISIVSPRLCTLEYLLGTWRMCAGPLSIVTWIQTWTCGLWLTLSLVVGGYMVGVGSWC